jgi:predicted Holliday junction resolvase-like endonuclease
MSVRSLLALLLILTLNLQVMSQMGIFAWFVLHNDYIASVLRENRSRPELHCKGQCILAKKLKASQEEERQQAASLLKAQKTELFAPVYFDFSFSPLIVPSAPEPNTPYRYLLLAAPVLAAFRPPKAV